MYRTPQVLDGYSNPGVVMARRVPYFQSYVLMTLDALSGSVWWYEMDESIVG